MDSFEKKYKDAFERARELSKTITGASYEYIFPELAESEDERIRKAIIELVRQSSEILGIQNQANMLAWLEKQEGCEYIKKDWLEHIKQSWYKEGFIDGKYTPKELTINDATTFNELIDFLENGTVKLQHDLTLYANWLKTQFSPNEKQGEQNPAWSEGDETLLSSVINSLLIFEDSGASKMKIDWLISLKQRLKE